MNSKTKTTAMKEDAKPALVPKLRFPEFLNALAWEPTTIGDIGSFYYGKSAPKWSLEKDAPTRCVRYGELYTKFGVIITETYSRTNIDPKNLRFSKGGEILVPRVGEKPEDFGKCCCYLPLANIAIGEMISVFETEQNPLFYTYYFRSLYRQFAKVVEGQNVTNLYYVELEPLPIHRPSLPEQQHIAECLTSLDELIAAHSRKLDALKTHKKALMQQLFPREGETIPRLRFPEFQRSPGMDQ
jgi:type I restriction enzyme S subunit